MNRNISSRVPSTTSSRERSSGEEAVTASPTGDQNSGAGGETGDGKDSVEGISSTGRGISSTIASAASGKEGLSSSAITGGSFKGISLTSMTGRLRSGGVTAPKRPLPGITKPVA